MSLILKLVILMFFACQLLNALDLLSSNPPPLDKSASLARYIMHNVDWVTLTTISTLKDVKGHKMSDVLSMSDGPRCKGSGVPYLYVPKNLAGMDMEVDRKCTLDASLAETDYCTKNFNPQDPLCARIVISGRLLKVDNATEEFKFAKSALFARHPEMAERPTEGFFVAKVNIETIKLDGIGTGIDVTPEDYFNANKTTDACK